jgi:hypothetical protein
MSYDFVLFTLVGRVDEPEIQILTFTEAELIDTGDGKAHQLIESFVETTGPPEQYLLTIAGWCRMAACGNVLQLSPTQYLMRVYQPIQKLTGRSTFNYEVEDAPVSSLNVTTPKPKKGGKK